MCVLFLTSRSEALSTSSCMYVRCIIQHEYLTNEVVYITWVSINPVTLILCGTDIIRYDSHAIRVLFLTSRSGHLSSCYCAPWAGHFVVFLACMSWEHDLLELSCCLMSPRHSIPPIKDIPTSLLLFSTTLSSLCSHSMRKVPKNDNSNCMLVIPTLYAEDQRDA